MCVVRSRSCRPGPKPGMRPVCGGGRKKKKKKKKKKSGPASTVWPRDEDRESLVRERGVARSDASEGYAPRVCAERGTERRRNAADASSDQHRGIGRRAGIHAWPIIRGSPANNLLVFHVRFDSLSFRYLYLPGLLPGFRGFRGFCDAERRAEGESGWVDASQAGGAARGMGEEKKKKNAKNRVCTHWNTCALRRGNRAPAYGSLMFFARRT